MAMDDIEKIARAMFDTSYAWQNTKGTRQWTWNRLDDASKQYWLVLAKAAHHKVRQLDVERGSRLMQQMLEHRYAGDEWR
jgi:hypothetical protein